MIALFAAMTVAAAPAVDARPRVLVAPRLLAAQPSDACSAGRYEIADRALLYRDDGRARASQLGQLPKAHHEKAVVRTVDGCAAPLVVGYEVGR